MQGVDIWFVLHKAPKPYYNVFFFLLWRHLLNFDWLHCKLGVQTFKPPILIYRKVNLFYHLIRGVNQFIGHCITIIPDSCFWLLFYLLWLKFIFQNFWIAKFVVWVILESWYFWSLDCGQTWCWPACRGSAPMTAFRELKLLPLSSSCCLSKIFHSFRCK